jgi:hypothetical protein
MGRRTTVFDVLISGPSDTDEERDVVEAAIHSWNAQHSVAMEIIIRPVRWEKNSSPDLSDEPQEVLNRQIVNDSDAVIAVFKDSIGSPTQEFVSGTAEEILRLHTAGRRVMVYFCEGKVERVRGHP